jgi:hypothetical protein
MTTLRGGSRRSRRRICRFSLQVGVRVENVPGPLPDEAEPVEPAADRLVRERLVAVTAQILSEQRHCPVHGGVTVFPGRLIHGLRQPALEPLVPQGRAAGSLGIAEGRRVVAAEVGVGPVVDGAGLYTEREGDVTSRPPPVKLQDRQRASVEADVTG